MGIIAPNQKKLLIPRKGAKVPNAPVSQSDHDANMRAIEIWANAQAPGGVTQIIAGTNITLDPTDGLGAVTINSAGGGGGGGVGILELELLPDVTVVTPPMWLGGTGGSSSGLPIGAVQIPLSSNSSGATQTYTFGLSWIAFVSGQSVAILPTWFAPTFTGSDLAIVFSMEALDYLAFTNYAQANPSDAISIASGASGQAATTDFPGGLNVTAGTDLSFVNGTGGSGNGIVSGGAVFVYLASITGYVSVADGVTFT